MWSAFILQSAAVFGEENATKHTFIENAKLGDPSTAFSMVLYFKTASDITEPMVEVMQYFAKTRPVVIEMVSCDDQEVVASVCEEQKDNLPYMVRSYRNRTVGSNFVNDVNVMKPLIQNWLKYFDAWTKHSHQIQRQFAVMLYTYDKPSEDLIKKTDAIEVTLPMVFLFYPCQATQSNECRRQQTTFLRLAEVGLTTRWAEQTALSPQEIDSMITDISKMLGIRKVYIDPSIRRINRDYINLVNYKVFVDPRILVFHMPGKDDKEMDLISRAVFKERLTVPIVRVSCSDQARQNSGLLHPDKLELLCLSKVAATIIPYNEETLEADLKMCHEFAKGIAYMKISPSDADRVISREAKAFFFFRDDSVEAKEQGLVLKRLSETFKQYFMIYEVDCKETSETVGVYCEKLTDRFAIVARSRDETAVINHRATYEELKDIVYKVLFGYPIVA
jgi:hypothetical protein